VADVSIPAAPSTPALANLRTGDFDDSIFDTLARRTDEDSADSEEDLDGDEPPAQREGLPPGFRMRHDAHYVEALVSRNRGSHMAVVPAAGHEAGPTNGGRPHDEVAKVPMTVACLELGQSLDAIGACLHLFPAGPRSATERVALDLIAGEVLRATWMVRALALLDEDGPVANTPVALAPVLRRVVTGLTPAASDGAIGIEGTSTNLCARGDEPLITLAVAAMAMSLQAVTAARVGAAPIQLAIREDADGLVVEASQDAVRMPSSWRARFFDVGWADRPGGRRVGIALSAAKRVAAVHDGALAIEELERGGCRLLLSLPRA